MSSLTTTERLKELLPQLFSTKINEGDYYLRFQLTDEISCLIELKYVQESLTIDGDRITPVPNLPAYILGLMSSRNQVFLAMDLAHLAGLPPQTVNLRQYQTIVVKLGESQMGSGDRASDELNLFGLTVKRIEGISRILPEHFIPVVENIPDALRSFVSSAATQEPKNETVSISDRVKVQQSFLIDISKLIITKTKS